MREYLRGAHLELGLEFPSTPEQVRAAYLKLLKTRKPDRDPEGFRRLRQAYESLKAFTDHPTPLEPQDRRDPPEQRPEERPVEALVPVEDAVATDELSVAKRWLAERLARLQLDPFSVTEQIRLLDRVQQRFPHDPDLNEWLASALMEAELDDEAARLLRDSIQVAQPDVKLRLWRFLFSRLPEHLSRYALLNAPATLVLGERLQLADLLVEKHREPTEAAEALKRILADFDTEAVARHSREITRIILKVMHAGFIFIASEIGRTASQRVDAHYSALLAELITISDRIPPPATKQIAWVLLAQTQPGLDVGPWDLAPHVISLLSQLLDQEAPALRNALHQSLPKMNDCVSTPELELASAELPRVRVQSPQRFEPERVPGRREDQDLGTPMAEVMRRGLLSLPELLLFLCLFLLAVSFLGWVLASL